MFRAVVLLLAVVFAPSVAAAQQPCTTDARHVVNELYRHMLKRQTDPGSAHWVTQLETSRMTVRDVVREIASSPEYSQRFIKTEAGESQPYERSVASLYRHILGRQPDPEGQRAFAVIAQRQGAAAVMQRLTTSREYNEQFGDWGVPGSGGIRYCGNGNVVSSSQSTANTASNNDTVPIGQRRFRGMDRNNDGVISRQEWRGSAQSFSVHDWNNDSVISGTEMNNAAARNGRTVEDEDFDRVDEFANVDVNRNGRIDANEWHGSVAAFNRLDVNNDDRLTQAEYSGQATANQAAATSGQSIIVDARQRWIDTGINVTQGALVMFDVTGDVRLSDDQGDLVGAGGAPRMRPLRVRRRALSSAGLGQAMHSGLGTSARFVPRAPGACISA